MKNVYIHTYTYNIYIFIYLFISISISINPFLLLNPTQILKTSVHPQFLKISDWPVWLLNWSPLENNLKIKLPFVGGFSTLILKTSQPRGVYY